MRWNTRSAPERSTRTATPGYFASNDFAIFSATARSIDVYQTTLPSFFAASISAGVMASAAGAAETTRAAKVTDAARAEEDPRKVRRDSVMTIVLGVTPPPFEARLRRAPQRDGKPHTLKILLYFALISSLIFSTAAASSFMVLISRNGARPGFSLVPGCIE